MAPVVLHYTLHIKNPYLFLTQITSRKWTTEIVWPSILLTYCVKFDRKRKDVMICLAYLNYYNITIIFRENMTSINCWFFLWTYTPYHCNFALLCSLNHVGPIPTILTFNSMHLQCTVSILIFEISEDGKVSMAEFVIIWISLSS